MFESNAYPSVKQTNKVMKFLKEITIFSEQATPYVFVYKATIPNFRYQEKGSQLINIIINYVKSLSCSELINHVACGASFSMDACNIHINTSWEGIVALYRTVFIIISN